jgi:hypothetical protein
MNDDPDGCSSGGSTVFLNGLRTIQIPAVISDRPPVLGSSYSLSTNCQFSTIFGEAGAANLANRCFIRFTRVR